MNFASIFRSRGESALVFLMAMQALCAILFLSDISGDLAGLGPKSLPDWHLGVEVFANVALVMAIVTEALYLRRLLRQHARNEKALSVARGALDDLMRSHFDSWGLTPAEADVATFTIKGFSIAEIAGLRQAAEGTVKSQLNAIYRKSGLAGRGQLVSVLIEDLLHGPIGQADDAPPPPPANGAGAQAGSSV
ncbi:MAG: helix-turn-helix transcriptional regulator [Paracoccaceae bacterium]